MRFRSYPFALKLRNLHLDIAMTRGIDSTAHLLYYVSVDSPIVIVPIEWLLNGGGLDFFTWMRKVLPERSNSPPDRFGSRGRAS